MWTNYLGSMKFEAKDIEILSDLSDGFSGSDIEEVSKRLKRRKVTLTHPPDLSDAFSVLQNLGIGEGKERRFLSELSGLEQPDIARKLRERDEGLYSHAAVARLLGVSKATAYRRAQAKVTNGG
jgi:hypothetical protein